MKFFNSTKESPGPMEPGSRVIVVGRPDLDCTVPTLQRTLRERLASLAKRLGLTSSKPSGNTPSGQN